MDLLEAAEKTWAAFLKHGPVDDGTPEGERFDKALTQLMHEANKVKARRKFAKQKRDAKKKQGGT